MGAPDQKSPELTQQYLLAIATPTVLAALRVSWTFLVLRRYAASAEESRLERAAEWYRVAFTIPEAVLAALLLVFVLILVASSKYRHPSVILTAAVASLLAFFATVLITFNAAFRYFKEVIG